MQISGTSTGQTMAASEPPEPPPRNPERINASLHKLSESKTVKSLDSTGNAPINDKSGNNNKPLKQILSLDKSVTQSGTTTANHAGVSKSAITGVGTSIATGAAITSTTTANVLPTALAQHLNSPSNLNLYFGKRSDLATANSSAIATTATNATSATTAAVATTSTATDSISPLSSNGSNHTLTSPMTIDNQLQHQQHQQQHPRFNYMNIKVTDTSSSALGQQSLLHMTQQQKGTQRNGVGAEINASVGLLIANKPHSEQQQQQQHQEQQQQQSINGSGGNSSVSSSNSSNSSNSANALNASNANAVIGNHNNQQATSMATAAATTTGTSADSANKLREENERLNADLTRLRKLLELSPEGAVGGVDLSDSNSFGDAPSTDGSGSTPQQRVDRLESELRAARSQLMSLRIERKKLRADKGDLLGQVKQLCASLQDKEQQLRDFIRNFQERVRETESNNAKLSGDRERERWQLLKQARDEAERSLALAQQLNARDMQLQRLQEQLQEARRQLSGYLSDQESLLSFAPLTPPSATSGLLNHMAAIAATGANMRTDDSGRGNSLSAFSGSSGATVGDRNSCSNDSVLRNSSDRESTAGDLNFSDGTCENGPCITVDPDSISIVSSQNMYQYGTPKERSPTLSPLNSAAYSRSVEQLGSPVDPDGPSGAIARKFTPKTTSTLGARNGRGGTWGSISRVFARTRNKNKGISADGTVEYSDYSWSPLSEEGYAEKLRLLREASQLPMERWRASQLLAWLEVALGMPQYSSRCAENVKSGKVLLELSDAELEAGLGLAHPMHRKKLRLAIEEQRRPEMVRYPMITQLGHTWVASEWLPDIGLPQYAESFLHSLVDARMLDTLSKKELEKFLGVTRKFHQASIVHGIHVLRIVKYDRQTLAMRRIQSETVDTDPIVWTNQRFIRWARSIDLGEYADNLKDSGVHGGLVVLEPSFSGDTMATALGIPPSKNIIRRHLSTEFDTLILPARATLGQGIRSDCGIVPITGPGGLQHYATTDRRSTGSLRISAWKGSQSSLSKAFRFNSKSNRSIISAGDRTSYGNSTSPTPSYSSSEGCGGIYVTIGTPSSIHQLHNHHQQQKQQHQPYHHHFPPPTTAPPPPPTAHNYGTQLQHIPGSRVSAPPAAGSRATLDSISDTNIFYGQQQQRRVKSISDIGVATTPTSALATAAKTTIPTKSGTMQSVTSGGSGGSGGSIGSFGGNAIRSASVSSVSPI